MKDLAKEIMLREMEIPKIHGEVDIRLKNPMTGKIVKQIKGENTFQSTVLAKGLRNLGTANSSYYVGMNNIEPWKQIVGGILLFKDSLSNAQYMQKGNKMQANGSYGITNNANPPELGSWNDNESSAGSGSLLMVYDWTTSQANGAGGISSVALTSDVGGYIGYGNPSETYRASSGYPFSKNQQISNGIMRNSYTQGCRSIQIGNILYSFTYDSTNKIITLKKIRVPLSQGSVFDWIVDSNNTVEIDVSSLHYSAVTGLAQWYCYLSDGKIYFFGANGYSDAWASNAKKYVWEYNPTNDAITEIEITNNTGSSITIASWGSISHGLLFVYAVSKTHVFKLSDNTYIGYIDNHGNGTPTNGQAVGTDFPGGLIYIPDNVNYTGTNGTVGRFYDTDNATCYPVNGGFGISNMFTGMYYDPESDTLNSCARDGAFAFNNPLYLATNYNLPSAVTKDSTMTMQVRYTLTEA